jgi:NAD(P)-dependent dehydrogenase (short-subunit alcohol dehydrogenase family)
MLRVLPYGATKSALESMSAIWAAELKERGITVNVLIPGGPTDTPFISEGAGWDRAKMLRPEIMGPPACWLISTMRRITLETASSRRILTRSCRGRKRPPRPAARSAGRNWVRMRYGCGGKMLAARPTTL